MVLVRQSQVKYQFFIHTISESKNQIEGLKQLQQCVVSFTTVFVVFFLYLKIELCERADLLGW